MRIPRERVHRWKSRGVVVCLTLLANLTAAAPARAQSVQIQSVEVSPLIGVRMAGTFEIQPDSAERVEATLQDAASYGFSAGVRFDDFSLVELRWMQSTSALRFPAPFAFVGPSVGDVTLNQLHADFTREFVIEGVKELRSFLTGSLGVSHLGAAHQGFTRFSFGLGAGLKLFLGSRLAIRAEAQWLPILVEPSVSGFACGAVQPGGCLVLLNGRLVQQFHLNIGPVVRF
jgi:hypothetical protein